MVELETSKLKGRTVVDSRGNHIGSVDDVLFNTDTWSVEALLVGLTKEAADDLNVKRSVMGSANLAISRGRINSIGDAVLLNVDARDLRSLIATAPDDVPLR